MQLTMEPLDEMLASARVMDRAGMDTIWLAEAYPWWRKHGMEARSSTVTSALIARETERLTIGWGIISPFTRHPVQVAMDARADARRRGDRPRGAGRRAVRVRGRDVERFGAGPAGGGRDTTRGAAGVRRLHAEERRRRRRRRLHRRRVDRPRSRPRPRRRARDRGHVPREQGPEHQRRCGHAARARGPRPGRDPAGRRGDGARRPPRRQGRGDGRDPRQVQADRRHSRRLRRGDRGVPRRRLHPRHARALGRPAARADRALREGGAPALPAMTRTITVRGRGFAPARPTEVYVSFESAAVRPTAAEAFAEAGERHAALDALCEELGIDESRRTTTQTSVHEFREQMEDPVSWRASYSTAVHVQDAELAGRLLREAVEKVETRVTGGPWWRVGADDPARLVACRLPPPDRGGGAGGFPGAPRRG